jgi:GGDEF domain-containing protein
LLVQEDVVLEYQIRAIVSQSAAVQRAGAFSTNDPLLTASMSRQPISVRRIEGGRDVVAGYLRYYSDPPAIDHIALAPVPLRDTHTTIFLLADATSESDLGAPHARALIEQFAETLALVLQSDAAGSVSAFTSDDSDNADDDHDSLHNDGAPSRTGTPRVRESDPVSSMDTLDNETVEKQSLESVHGEPDADKTKEAPPEDAKDVQEDAPDGSDQKPRPRGEIIAEEMDRADRNNTHLALVLVHLNRSESIARAGEKAVASAEKALRDRLYEAAPEQRVERFGELTYGVFFRGGLSHVEPWAINMQDQMDAATGELEGGASIGVAMRGPRHDTPEALRADATQALHEAYKTGTCTIIE